MTNPMNDLRQASADVSGVELLSPAALWSNSMTSNTRAQRLVDEFDEAASFYGGYSVRHGIAAVLRHLADTDAQYGDMESWYAVPTRILEDLADALEAPTLLERAMAGDAAAAKKFLHQSGFTDERGQWLPQYQPTPETTND